MSIQNQKGKNQQSRGLVCRCVHASPQHFLCAIHLLSLNRWENHVVTDGRPFCSVDDINKHPSLLHSWWGLHGHRSLPWAARQHNYSNEVFKSTAPAECAVWNQLVMCSVVVEQTCQCVAVLCEIFNIANGMARLYVQVIITPLTGLLLAFPVDTDTPLPPTSTAIYDKTQVEMSVHW